MTDIVETTPEDVDLLLLLEELLEADLQYRDLLRGYIDSSGKPIPDVNRPHYVEFLHDVYTDKAPKAIELARMASITYGEEP